MCRSPPLPVLSSDRQGVEARVPNAFGDLPESGGSDHPTSEPVSPHPVTSPYTAPTCAPTRATENVDCTAVGPASAPRSVTDAHQRPQTAEEGALGRSAVRGPRSFRRYSCPPHLGLRPPFVEIVQESSVPVARPPALRVGTIHDDLWPGAT